ncbi:MAG TPA: alpha/beta hydrolase [Steroidobacteraceae bacterium]|nr:alpha/beta hydrolase [Steroidobacteraceae bacterium]HRX90054.1 alpha/beta hydrolase [Steroidobacteraceae bacterium]
MTKVTARIEFRDIRGLRHRLVRWGPESPDPIVLLHGFMDCALTFQFLVDELPADWSLVAPDWRGFGGTDSTGVSYWFPDYLADLEELLDVLTPDVPARVIGHSMGGNIASLYAGVRPDRLRWLVNLEGFGLRRVGPEMAPVRYAEWLDQLRAPRAERRYESPAQLAAILLRRNPRLSPATAQFVAAAWTRPTADGGFELATDPMHRLANPVLYRRDEAEACWRRMQCPMLMVLGEHSEYWQGLGVEGTDEHFRTIYRQAQLVTLPGVGHMLHHEDPAAVAAAIRRFVTNIE